MSDTPSNRIHESRSENDNGKGQSVMSGFPLVLSNDDGIRPAGRPNACFYCNRNIGEPHSSHCVAVKKLVQVRYVFTIGVYIPHFWGKSDVLSHRNGGSWCADNALDEIGSAISDSRCLCGNFKCESMHEIDGTPSSLPKDELAFAPTLDIQE